MSAVSCFGTTTNMIGTEQYHKLALNRNEAGQKRASMSLPASKEGDGMAVHTIPTMGITTDAPVESIARVRGWSNYRHNVALSQQYRVGTLWSIGRHRQVLRPLATYFTDAAETRRFKGTNGLLASVK